MRRTMASKFTSVLPRALFAPAVVILFLLVLQSQALAAPRSISGTVKNASNVAISGVTMTLSGAGSATTTTDASGNYTLNATSSGTYIVTPSKTNYTLSPASRSYTNMSANQTAQNYTGTSTITYTISGNIQNASAVAISGVTMTLSGGQSSSATTDGSGNYSFPNLPATNNYTVTPSLANYTFSAPSLTYNNLSANQTTADFAGTSTITYTISGHIQNASATAIAGVTVTLSGGQAGTTTTDGSGNYSFAGLPSTNNYAVMPSKISYTFDPTTLIYNNLGANQTDANFTGTLRYSISGHIQDASATAIVGVIVALSGGQTGTTTTDGSGNYSFAGLASTNNYTITPSRSDYIFTPVSLSYNNLSANQSTADFTGTRLYDISGHIQDEDTLEQEGIIVSLSGSQTDTATTDVSGNYSFVGLPEGGNYIVTPSTLGYAYSPGSLTFNNLSATGQANFTTLSTASISGHIQTAGSVAISGVTVSLSGEQTGTTTTDASGNYSFAALTPSGNYTVTPSKASYTFSPTSVSHNNLSANQTTTNFTGTLSDYDIEGSITDAQGGGIAGVTVTLSGGQAGTTTTDGSGYYLFEELAATGNYKVTPSKTNYVFSPADRDYNNLGANIADADFTGTSTITYTISGHIQNASGHAIVGATVTLSGGQAGTTTTDDSGDYSFGALPSTNNYTVTPSLTNYTFSDASLTYTNLAANQTTADFIGTSTITYTISGHIQNPSAVAISGVTVTLSGGQSSSATTDGTGYYSFPNLPSTNNYTVTPSLTNYTFSPSNRTYNNLGANQTAANFTQAQYEIDGAITDSLTGLGIDGVTITLSGSQSDTRTSAAGNGAFIFEELLSGGNYTITPSKTNYIFSPVSRTYNNLSTSQYGTDADFIATAVYTISGNIIDAMQTALSGVTVTLSGGQTGTATTDASGNYSFANLPTGGNYTVTPSKTDYTFSPIDRTYNNLSADQTTANFTGTSTITYTISGHIQNASAVAISGVTVSLTGGQSGSTTTDASGNYSFAGLPSTNNYTVTPSLANYTFSPVSLPYNSLAANQTAANFTGTLAGVPDVTLTASVSPTGSADPGTDLVYTIDFSNVGGGGASAFVVTDPIPTNTDFKIGSVTTGLGTTGLTVAIAYSNDIGPPATWTYTPESEAGSAPAGYDRNVKHVRWTFTGSLSQTAPNNAGSVGLTARIR